MLSPPPLPRTLEASLRDLDSARAEIRASAIADLVRHARGGDAVLRDKAIKLVLGKIEDADPRVRAAVAIALGDLDAKEHVSVLLARVEDDDAQVRQMALNALGEIKDAGSLPRLRRALADPRPEVRYQAVIAFSRVSDDDAEVDQALLVATNDDDDAIAHIALRIIEERIDDAGKKPDERLLVRARTLLKKASPHVALVAAIVLAKTGDTDVHPILLDVVRGKKLRGAVPEKEDEQAAVELMGALGLREAIPDLERRAWGVLHFVRDTCPFHAKIALARLGNPRARAELLKDLDATRPDVLAAAVVAAGRARLEEARPKLEKLTTAAVDPALVEEALSRLGNE